MAAVIESTSSKNITTTATHSVPAPTGIEVGDLLVAICCGLATSSVDTPAGWTKEAENTNSGDVAAVLYKIADSGDVAASTFSFSFDSGNSRPGSVGMMRITGATESQIVTADVDGSTGTSTGTISLTPFNPNGLLAYGVISDLADNEGQSYGAYTVSGGGTNPTWTEVLDYEDSVNAYHTYIIAGVYEDDTEVTAITATTEGTGGVFTNGCGIIVSIAEIVNSAGSTALLEVSPVQFAQNGIADTNATADLHEVSPTQFAQSGRGTSPTQWTNETKPSTTWTKEQK